MVRVIHDEPSIQRRPLALARVLPLAPSLRSTVVPAVAATLLLGAVAWPLLFTGSAFNPDWLEQLWLMWQQGLAIRADHLPSLFLNYHFGVLYPHYLFYGATLYVLTGTLALALGDAPMSAYVSTYVLSFVAAYGGWYWLARLAGLRGWSSHAPGVVFVTASYYLSLVYSRGDWPEFVAVSVIPLMLAAAISVLRADRLRAGPALALVASTILFAGSHSLTLIWGSTAIVLVGVATLACVPEARRQVTRAGALRVAGLALPALLVNAWFLLPAAVYESTTHIASEYAYWRLALRETLGLVSAGNLFTLSRASVSTPTAAFAVSLPIVAIAWTLVGIALLLATAPCATWTRVALICAWFGVVADVMMTHVGLILALPRPYAMLQFSYRLESYVLLGLCGAVLAVLAQLRAVGGRPRLWGWLLSVALAVSIVGAVQQTAAYPRSRQPDARYTILARDQRRSMPFFEQLLPDYIDVHQPLVRDPAGGLPAVEFPLDAVHDNRVSTVVHLRPGTLAASNLLGPPSLVQVSGARIVGIDSAGYEVLEIEAPPLPGGDVGAGTGRRAPSAQTISLSPAHGLPVVLGAVLTLLALSILLAQFVVLAVRAAARARS